MSFTSIKPYIEARMTAVDADYREWTDAFNIANIPSNILEKSWHLAFGTASPITLNQNCLSYSYPVVLNVFFKGYQTPSNAIDSGNLAAENILKEVLANANRLNISAVNAGRVINILPGTFSLNPLADSNDNIVRLELNFTFNIIYDL